MILKRTTKLGVDISSSQVEVMTFTYTGDEERLVVIRVDMGDDDNPIEGNGLYSLRAAVNGSVISPDSGVNVASDAVKATVSSKQLPLFKGDVLTVSVQGNGGDTNVDITAVVMDATPARASDLFGSGTIAVNEDYGGNDALSYRTFEGAGVDNAIVTAYLSSDYTAGNRSSAYVKGTVRTLSTGNWANSMWLDPGTYTLVYSKPGAYGPDTKELVVS